MCLMQHICEAIAQIVEQFMRHRHIQNTVEYLRWSILETACVCVGVCVCWGEGGWRVMEVGPFGKGTS